MVWFAWVGLAVTILGIACGLFAYGTTLKEYDPPIVKWWPRFLSAFRRLSIWIGTLFARPRAQVIRPIGVASEEQVGRPMFRVGDIEIPDHLPLAEQIRLLVRRVEHVEAVARTDREQVQKLGETLRVELTARVERLEVTDTRIESDARRMSLGSGRLQMVGLLLVGAGTVLMTVPALL